MNSCVSLAKKAVEYYVKKQKVISVPRGLPKEFYQRKSGVFVTIMIDTQLRGCIGTYLPTKENITEEIISNAVAAAAEDYRFPPVQKKELPRLSYTVYILNEPELVKDITELDPRKYGIIVKTFPVVSPDETDVVFNGKVPHKSGLLLPGLEGIDDAGKQILIACQKGRIDPAREKLTVYRFTVKKYE